jgi:seryl-tRNA synthetase
VYKSHNAFNRKAPLAVGAIQSIERLYSRHKELSRLLNGKRHAQSLIGERIRQVGKADEQARRALLLQEAKRLKADISQLEQDLAQADDELFSLASAVPNDTHPLAPLGPESAAAVLSSHGPEPLPPSPHRDHLSISRQLGLIDLEAGATVTGSSWYYLLREAALLETALTNYGLSIALNHGFTPVTTPDVVRSDVARRCGFQPRDNSHAAAPAQMYHLAADADAGADSHPHPHPELVLSGTAEIPLAGMFANKILPLEDLPLKVVGLGRAFRAEAGARGADTRGLYRVHQFTKLELFAVSRASQSEEVMEEMRRVQVEIFNGLGFPFRCVDPPPTAIWHLWLSRSQKYLLVFWTCPLRSLAPARIVSTTSKRGCLDEVTGARSLHCPTAPSIKLAVCTFAIDLPLPRLPLHPYKRPRACLSPTR